MHNCGCMNGMPQPLTVRQDYFQKDRKEWAYQRLLGSLKVRAGKLDIPIVNPAEERAEKEQERRERKEREEKTQQEIEFRRKTEFELRNANQVLQFQLERIEQLVREEKEAEQHASIAVEQSAKKESESRDVQDAEERNKIKDRKWSDRLTIEDIEFIRIPKGIFIMGDGAEKNEVDISYDYFVARFPVTNQLFRKFVDATSFSKSWGVSNWNKKLDHPVVNVSWHIAQDYCKWLSKKYAKELPEGRAFRLPTEAEWERAARGLDGRLWPWGNKFDQNRCNSRESNLPSTTPIGKYSPQGDSPYGIADMAGNVWEWTHSLDKPYPYRIDDGRESDEANKGKRILRGGSFVNTASNVRAVVRYGDDPDLYFNSNGFRVALAPHLPK